MHYINGGDLFDWAQNLDAPVGPKREELIKPIARKLARAIQTLHEKHIAHRDLSCENILLEKSFQAICLV